MKKKFSQYLLEQWGETNHEQGGGNQIKVDIIDLMRSHVKQTNNEVLFADLRSGKEKEQFYYYFDKLMKRYPLDGIRKATQFRNNFTIVFNSPELKKGGRYVQVFARFPNEQVAADVYNELTSKFKYKDPNTVERDF